MRLSESKIKNGILHPDQDVRDVAVSYFSGTSSDDRSIMAAAIKALETYGWQATFSDVSVLESLIQKTLPSTKLMPPHLKRELEGPDTITFHSQRSSVAS